MASTNDAINGLTAVNYVAEWNEAMAMKNDGWME